MKQVILSIAVAMTLSTTAFATNPCEKPRGQVLARIDLVYFGDVGPSFCYATELNNSHRYEVLDCGYHQEGDIVTGTVYTHWTHRSAQGQPVCDYQTFAPAN